MAFSPDGRLLALPWGQDRAVVWEVATGRPRAQLVGHVSGVAALSFSADGMTLATGSGDGTAVVWDLSRRRVGRLWAAEPAPAELEALWDDLGGEAVKADHAIRALAAAPRQSVPFLDARLRPLTVADAKRVERLVAELDDDAFEVRRRAGQELERLGGTAEAALRAALRGRPSAEVRRRAEELVGKLEGAVASGERLRACRALEALEQGGAEARPVLEALAKGTPASEVARQAGAILKRWDDRRTGPPAAP
jgi:hypothetical protein